MSDIAYQNKDITLKYFADTLIDKSLAVYGLPHIRIKDCRPTNLPAIEANELRLDNLFILEDGSWFAETRSMPNPTPRRAREARRAQGCGKICELHSQDLKAFHLIIFSTDIGEVDPDIMDVGCMQLKIEPAYLLGIDTEEVFRKVQDKIKNKEVLGDDELLELIILPLTVKGREEKQALAEKTVELAL